MAASKGNTGVSADQPLQKAAHFLSGCIADLYALDDVGRRFAGNPFSPLTMAQVVWSLTDSMREHLDAAEEAIPGRLVHKAHIEIAAASDALAKLDQLMELGTGDGG